MEFLREVGSEDEIANINTTSLVDVVFLLLIFFMVSTTFSDPSGISVNLPSSKAPAANETMREPLSVTIDKNGKVFFRGSELQRGDLVQRVAAIRTEKPSELSLVVRADKTTPHGSVVGILDEARTAGITRVAIATSPETSLDK